jgi:glycine cleavage system aminomethyltransferase T/glycine/D-amino acid oxidase-like deaminating enzyme
MRAAQRRDIVVIGGGAIGLSVAYHLGQLGLEDVLLLERDRLTSGTSWHAAGIVGPLRSSINLTSLARYSLDLFVELERETGQATGYCQTGGVWLAQNAERMTELRRIKAMGDRSGLATGILGPAAIAERLPFLHTADLAGGLWVEQDGQVNPVDLCMAYARGARARGVEIREHAQVVDIELHQGSINAIILADQSRIECKRLVLCAGAWTRQLAAGAGVDIPLVTCEHIYLVTDVVAALPNPCPIIRDLDAGIYLKGDQGKLVLGAFESNPRHWTPQPSDAGFLMFDEDWEHVEPMLEAGIRRVPVIANQGITHFMNGPESFTPDTRQIMGEAPNCRNLFVAAGFNSIGIMSSAGVGKVMAEWVHAGEAPMDLWEVDIARLDPLQASDKYLAARLPEAVHNQFAMHWPYKQYRTGRDLRRSVWHERLAQQGAVFGAPTGWERPLYFAADDSETALPYSYGEQAWWPLARREVLHCQRGVSLFELSPFGKFDVTGDDALLFLQETCCTDIDIEPGRAIYSLMLNRRGGIEAEVTVTRLTPNHFRVVGGAATRFKDLYWLRRRLRPGSDVAIHDVTEDYAVIGVMGPDSRNLLQELSGTDFNAAAFPFSTLQSIRIGESELFALRLSFVGELGWELYIQCADALSVLDRLITAGRDFDLGFAGHYALDGCRLEMGYRHWGHDIGSGDTPIEAGLGFAVCFDKPFDFLGKTALLESRHGIQKRRLRLCEVVANPVLILHDEPVYSGGKIVGHCTSGGQGFRTGKTLCFVMYYYADGRDDYCDDLGDHCEIEVAGERFPLAILDQPPYRANT